MGGNVLHFDHRNSLCNPAPQISPGASAALFLARCGVCEFLFFLGVLWPVVYFDPRTSLNNSALKHLCSEQLPALCFLFVLFSDL